MQDIIPIIRAAQSGDAQAFEILVRQYQDKAFAIALGHLGDYHLAQDAVQEGFVEAWGRLGQLSAPEAFWTWLHRIVRGKCVRQLRTGKSVVARVPLTDATEYVSHLPGPEDVAVEVAARQELRHALRVLSQEERQALLLYAVGGFTYQEIAGEMQMSLPLVKKRIFTARGKLRSLEWLKDVRPSERNTLPGRVRLRAESRASSAKETKMQNTQKLPTPQVELVGPGPEYKTVIKNLFAFYRYDLLPYIEGEPLAPDVVTDETWTAGAWVNQAGVINGLHSETHEEAAGMNEFWERPNLQAFLIKMNGWPAGFAFVASPPNATPGVDFRLQEFFVINKARGRGVGTQAARQLFDKLPGKWELAYDPQRPDAVALWKRLVPEVSGGRYHDEMIYVGGPEDMPGYVFTVGPE